MAGLLSRLGSPRHSPRLGLSGIDKARGFTAGERGPVSQTKTGGVGAAHRSRLGSHRPSGVTFHLHASVSSLGNGILGEDQVKVSFL